MDTIERFIAACAWPLAFLALFGVSQCTREYNKQGEMTKRACISKDNVWLKDSCFPRDTISQVGALIVAGKSQ